MTWPNDNHSTRLKAARNGRAYLLIEMTVAVALLAIILVAFTTVMTRFASSVKRLRAQHQAVFAAESELDRLRAGASPSSPEDVAKRFGNLSLTVDRKPAPAAWSGFEQVTVTVRQKIGGRPTVTCRLSAYLPPEKKPAGSEDRS